ncbi:MAG: chemotaxis protein CheD [Oscillospiraceae bacterium]|nr:chemotaxis protein CheD [Oscillospiraceae bacterium]
MAEALIKVGMADLKASAHPSGLTTLGLGSCVGISLYDAGTKVIGMAHIMLPDSKHVRDGVNKAKFADTAVEALVGEMLGLGARKGHMVAKLAGGAQMFALSVTTDLMKVGLRNAIAAKDALKAMGIPVVAEETGGSFGRTIELYSVNGRLLIKTIGHGMREL